MTLTQLQDLLADMTLEEKILQLQQLTGSFYEQGGLVTGPMAESGITQKELDLSGSVLGSIGAAGLKEIQNAYLEKQPHRIPLIFMTDIINGYRTIFPVPLAQGCTFDPAFAEKCAAIAAAESAAAGLHATFSPMVDLVRDARWGRVMESTGEDPYLNSCFARAMIAGYQGSDMKEEGRLCACVKHFAGYGAPEAGRDYNTVELSERTFRQDYLPAYQAAVEAGSGMVMTSFNTLNRVPATANRWLMRDVLREEMGFDGVLISDWGAIHELVPHGIAEDDKEAALLALQAGVDIDMMGRAYSENLAKLLAEGSICEAEIDECVMRVLELKNRLGLFENPYKDADEEKERQMILCEENRAAARTMAERSFVLLKNEGGILPIMERKQKIAFIGPYVDNQWLFGSWSMFGRKEDTVSIKTALERRSVKGEYRFAKGCCVLAPGYHIPGLSGEEGQNLSESERQQMLTEAEEAAAWADVVVLALGEHSNQSGEALSRADITLSEHQMDLVRRVSRINSNIVSVLFSGRPLDIRELCECSGAVLEVWMPGTEGGTAIVNTLFGDTQPSGRLAMSFPYCVGQVPVSYNTLATGRPAADGNTDRFLSKYLDIPNEPLFPFGYGLTYTQFEYSPVILENDMLEMRRGEESEIPVLTAHVSVKNTGGRAALETVQMYIQDVKGNVARPVRELKGFQQVWLEPGEEQKLLFSIREDMLCFWQIDGRFAAQKGEFRVFIGGDSSTQNVAVFHNSSDTSELLLHPAN